MSTRSEDVLHPPLAPGPADRAFRESHARELVRVYVWEIPVRVSHWLIFLSLFVLAATGFYIGSPFVVVTGEAGRHFFMGTVKVVHSYAAIVFALAVIARIVWMFLGNRYARWDKLLPVRERRWKGLWPTVEFYLFGARKPPGFVGHNPVAGVAYLLVYGLCILEILTGLALYSASAPVGSWLGWFGFLAPLFGGLQTARWIHHVIMWLLLGFFVHHLYSGWLMSQIDQNATMESIFSGYKFVPEEDLVYSGYRFVPRTGHVERIPREHGRKKPPAEPRQPDDAETEAPSD
jgi:Ni/Fe-hydrogenase 1 B-type cytochrome subunit